jgi:3-hydroxymyristoyl/3-hydroxydecanoyl-(acyl carrier protein) dehydratase
MTPATDAHNALLNHSGDSQQAEGCFRFAADLPVFSGHFPGNPLVPGVYILACAQVLAGKMLGRTLTVQEIKRAKWSAPLLPEQDLTVQLRLSEEDGDIMAKAKFRIGEQACGSAQLRLS